MQLQMSFLEALTTPGAMPIWTTLDDEQRAEVLAVLGRLIAKVATNQAQKHQAETKELSDE